MGRAAALFAGYGGTDITAPVLSSAQSTSQTDVTAVLSVATDTNNGTMWWVVVAAADSAPSSAQIRAGHNVAGTTAIATNGPGGTTVTTSPFTASASGLTASTSYKVHFTQDDLAANHATVASSSSFSTASSAWTPATLGANLIAWYYAGDNAGSLANVSAFTDAGSTLATNNQTIQQWNDVSGNGHHMKQPTSGNRPKWLSAGYNSHPCIQFTASTITGMVTDAITGSPFTSACSFFCVGQMLTGTTSFGRYVTTAQTTGAEDANNAASYVPLIRDATNNTVEGYGTVVTSLSPKACSLATNHRFGSIYDGSHVQTFLDNVAGTNDIDTTIAMAASIRVGIGMGLGVNAAFDTTTPWDGPMTELVITNNALGSTDRGLLDTYFTNKWGT